MSLSRLIFVVMVVLLLATPSLASQCPIQGLGQEWESVPPTDKDVEELARKTTAVYLADNLPPSPPCTPLPDKAELQVLAACTKQVSTVLKPYSYPTWLYPQHGAPDLTLSA